MVRSTSSKYRQFKKNKAQASTPANTAAGAGITVLIERPGNPYFREHALDLTLHRGSLEKLRIHLCKQADRITKHEIRKVFLTDQTIFDGLIGLDQNLCHVRHVPVTEV